MKSLFASLMLLMLFSEALMAQTMDVELPATQAFYAEAGGAGLPYSFNYDFRFDKMNIDSWGMRVGLSAYALNESNFFSLPIQITRLFGRNSHYFEIGGGLTFVAFKSSYTYCDYTASGQYICDVRSDYTANYIIDITGSPNAVGTLIFGYRRIPENGGFMWRANINPLFNSSGFWPLWPGIGIGYAFK